MSADSAVPLRQTPLHPLHRKLGAKMVPFAGYDMPVQYTGIIAEHVHARTAAVLFDVSHMGQASLAADGVKAFEHLVVGDIRGLAHGQMRYTLFTNESGGIIDDLMVVNGGTHLWLIVNAARKDVDFAHLQGHLSKHWRLELLEDRALLALQGPEAASVLARLAPAARLMMFMTSETLTIGDIKCWVTRSGYTGEDGFEISVPADQAVDLAEMLLAEPEVKPAGLGARDTLRLEAGLCLYGNDIDETTTPIEAGLAWTIQRRRREEGGFLGQEIILRQLTEGPKRRRVGIRLDGRAPARAGTTITDADGRTIGHLTSGGFAPSLGGPVAMGYVLAAHAAPGTSVLLVVRDRPLTGKVVKLPFVPHRYVR